MKKTLSIIALTVLVWSCSHKMTPAAAGSGTGAGAGSGTTAAAPSATSSSAPVAVIPEDKTGSKTAPATDAAKASSPEILGQSTYNAKCGRCHGLKVTTDYTSDRWVSIMQVMAPKAHLDDTEKSNVLAYVKANAKK